MNMDHSAYHPFNLRIAADFALAMHINSALQYKSETGDDTLKEPDDLAGIHRLAMADIPAISAYYDGFGADPRKFTQTHSMLSLVVDNFDDAGKIIFDANDLMETLLRSDNISDTPYAPFENPPFQSQYIDFSRFPLPLETGDLVVGAYVSRHEKRRLTTVAFATARQLNFSIPLRDDEQPTVLNNIAATRIIEIADGSPQLTRITPDSLSLTTRENNGYCMIIGAILAYIGSEKPDIVEDWPDSAPADLVARSTHPNKGEREKWIGKLEARGFRKVRFIGRTIGAHVRAVREEASRRGVATHRRRGHWRRVAIGVGRTGRRWHLFPAQLIMGNTAAPEATIYEMTKKQA